MTDSETSPKRKELQPIEIPSGIKAPTTNVPSGTKAPPIGNQAGKKLPPSNVLSREELPPIKVPSGNGLLITGILAIVMAFVLAAQGATVFEVVGTSITGSIFIAASRIVVSISRNASRIINMMKS